MKDEKQKENQDVKAQQAEENKQEKTNNENTAEAKTDEKSEKEDENMTKASECEEKLAEINDKYMRLSAEFDNYRKRTAREKLDILRNGGEEIIKGLLPVLDDFDRGVQSMQTATDINAIKEGVLLIQNKLLAFLKSQGLEEIESMEKELNTDLHDAVTKFPVQDKAKKGKIIDVAQKGYKLNDKVIRYAKVIVGE